MVDSVITYTLSINAVRKPHLQGEGSVHLFSEFTIVFDMFGDFRRKARTGARSYKRIKYLRILT